MKMKKTMFLMLTLMILGAASMNAQVKIGGDGTTGPVDGAVLELDGNKGALLLPRVDALATIASPTAGMQVYLKSDNQVYIYDGTKWNVYTGATGATGPQGAPGTPADVSAVPGTVKKITHYSGTGTMGASGGISVTISAVTTLAKACLSNVGANSGSGAAPRAIFTSTTSVTVFSGLGSADNGKTMYYNFDVIEYN